MGKRTSSDRPTSGGQMDYGDNKRFDWFPFAAIGIGVIAVLVVTVLLILDHMGGRP